MKVFLCSTYSDLVTEREAVIGAIRALQLQHEAMEFFGAKADRPIEVCLAEVAKSNILVVIVGHRYGSIVPGQSISFSEAEYKEAQRLNKPCLVYMRDASVPVLPKDFERDPDKLRPFAVFRDRLTQRHTIATFQGPRDLAERVRSDLLQNITLLESSAVTQRHVNERRSAFLAELERIVTSALDSGLREALILAAVQGALADLLGRPPVLSTWIAKALTSFLDRLKSAALPGRERPWVFISYAHHDRAAVDAVAEELPRFGLRTWVDQQELFAGDSLVSEIQRGLDRARAMVFFASKFSLGSDWARHELEYFMQKRLGASAGPPVIPVVLDDVELPALLRDILYIDMRIYDARETARRIAAAALSRRRV